MHQRIDAGTDVAMIGVWDARHGEGVQPICDRAFLEREAVEGRLFLIHTGADGGGAIDLYIDENPPDHARAHTRPIEGEFLLAVPTGRLVVAGAETYRTGTESNSVDIPPGDYAVRCHVAIVTEDDAEGGGEYNSIAEVETKVLTPEERAYYHRWNKRELLWSLFFWVLLLAFFPLMWRWGWKIALPITLALLIPYSHWLERSQKRQSKADSRWQAINRKVSGAWLGSAPRTFMLELRRLSDRAGLKGGSVAVSEDRREKRGFDPVNPR